MRRHLILGAVVSIGLIGYAEDLFADDKLCALIKDRTSNGDRDFAALIKHVSDDKLVLWGWSPGQGRAPVPVPHDIFVTRFKRWADAGGPCPVLGG